MAKRKNPDTSIEAYHRVTPEMLNGHHKKIVSALQIIGASTYEKIADYVGMDKHQVGRRLKELVEKGVLVALDDKLPTKTERMAHLYCVSVSGEKVEKKSEKSLPGKSVSDYSKELMKKQTPVQTTLF